MSSLSLPPPGLSLPGGAVASVDEVAVLAVSHGGGRHTLSLVVVRRYRRRRWGMSLSSLLPYLSYHLDQICEGNDGRRLRAAAT